MHFKVQQDQWFVNFTNKQMDFQNRPEQKLFIKIQYATLYFLNSCLKITFYFHKNIEKYFLEIKYIRKIKYLFVNGPRTYWMDT